MSRNTLFIEDVYGKGWENELGDEARIEPRAEVVRGLTASRYRQLWRIFAGDPKADILAALADGMSLVEAAGAVGISPRQVKNAVAAILARVSGAVAQGSFLPPPRLPTAGNMHIERRPRSRRGRPPSQKALPMAPGVRGQEQVSLPF